ncbi:MAG TPA: hypothetical protein VI968_00275 [archaeon]|nr:hypothetical protein [archaeon]
MSTAFVENSYANEEKASYVLDSFVEAGDSVLVEGSAFRYYTKKIPFGKVITNFWFDYNGDGKSEEADYRSAVSSGVFKAIMTTGNYYNTKISIDEFADKGPYRLFYQENQSLFLGQNIAIKIYIKS